VSASRKEIPVSLLEYTTDGRIATNSPSINQSQQNGFYSLDESGLTDGTQNAIQAVIHETQTLVAGSTVKLRLINDVYINGKLIPKDNFLFGEAKLNDERLDIEISGVRYQNSLFPVQLSVYDMDGMNGIYIPGAITRDVAKQSADRTLQGIGLTTLDPSLGAQAASAGIEAARDLISKKVKLVKVTVKAGYQVLLMDEKQKQNNKAQIGKSFKTSHLTIKIPKDEKDQCSMDNRNFPFSIKYLRIFTKCKSAKHIVDRALSSGHCVRKDNQPGISLCH
jgi:conjugative transposon TraM protein